MPADLIRFPSRSTLSQAGAAPRASGDKASPVASLALILRSAPSELQPLAVAIALIETGTNAAAAPVWNELKARWRGLVIKRGVRGRALDRLCDEWRAAVRSAGIAEKCRRRAGADAVSAWMASGGLHDG